MVTVIRSSRTFRLLPVLLAFLSGTVAAASNLEWQIQNSLWSRASADTQVTGHDGTLLVLFPGYSVQRRWAEQWAEALAVSAEARDVAEIWVFAGPESVFYESRALPVAASLDRLQRGRKFERVVVVAHSSGSFPAHLWLNQLSLRAALTQRYRDRVDYVNLDGGSGEGLPGGDLSLSNGALAMAGQWLAVSVRDSATGSFSANHEDMVALASRHPEQFTHRLLEAEPGCSAGAGWCLHDVPINRRPHNSETFDLQRDYTTFNSGHPVNTDWWPTGSEK
ncbi:hypothetical protein AWR36_002280 [Microbulbifer flavimaris]|uniref:Alpha/beta hydrolase n=1 Tax=Microbulbifer flavimaris TaxID=1781068 RepID=A0ABX4I3I2_9GAMM|nr:MULTISPECIES: hypothetical protein [Microbulbifer]KUJ84521.1 hypothetical protein AVO43_02285 [Microbulbifer sp. ZGT114]PCO06608.1 hypothetical protein AWR36_002280 [Microbulbifer flavimaris]